MQRSPPNPNRADSSGRMGTGVAGYAARARLTRAFSGLRGRVPAHGLLSGGTPSATRISHLTTRR